jgi:hypothetical protein
MALDEAGNAADAEPLLAKARALNGQLQPGQSVSDGLARAHIDQAFSLLLTGKGPAPEASKPLVINVAPGAPSIADQIKNALGAAPEPVKNALGAAPSIPVGNSPIVPVARPPEKGPALTVPAARPPEKSPAVTVPVARPPEKPSVEAAAPPPSPAQEYLTPDNVSKELLKSILDAAFMDCTIDQQGDLRVKDRVTCWILPNPERKDRIEFQCYFGFKPEATHEQRLEAVNRMNNGYAIIKATVGNNDILRFSYDLMIGGGITRKAFVLSVKRFCSIPHDAVADYGGGVVQ